MQVGNVLAARAKSPSSALVPTPTKEEREAVAAFGEVVVVEAAVQGVLPAIGEVDHEA